MKITHDFHIHTNLSVCAKETAKTENYVNNAKAMGLTKIGFSNHFWDAAVDGRFDFYAIQDYNHLAKILPEIKNRNTDVKIYFGCECEYDPKHRGVAITEETAEKFDYILVPNSHTHITMPKEYYTPYEKHASFMIQAFEDTINSSVSKYITAMAHPFGAVCCPYDKETLIKIISDDTFCRLFEKTAKKDIAFEINTHNMQVNKQNEDEIIKSGYIRMYRLAKKSGMKFIFGSDAHDSKTHQGYKNIADFLAHLLELKENDIAEIAR